MKNKFIKTLSVILIISILIVGIVYINKNNVQESELTQLQANSHRQMMGYIIKTPNKIIVIDGGTKEDATNLKKYIDEFGGKVDIWFITHPHSDHAGAIQKIVNETDIKINKLYYTLNPIEWYNKNAQDRAFEAEEFYELLKNDKIKQISEEVCLNQKINIDFIKCEILGIKNPEITEDAVNNSSMVIKMQLKENSILFLGDTGVKSGEKLLKNQKEKLKSDIVQVSHHGQNGANEELYKEIKPSICLWPTPEWIWNNDNGEGENTGPWATFETRSWMEKLQVKQHIIEKDGDITIKVK